MASTTAELERIDQAAAVAAVEHRLGACPEPLDDDETVDVALVEWMAALAAQLDHPAPHW
jgi:hypothetical protein